MSGATDGGNLSAYVRSLIQKARLKKGKAA